MIFKLDIESEELNYNIKETKKRSKKTAAPEQEKEQKVLTKKEILSNKLDILNKRIKKIEEDISSEARDLINDNKFRISILGRVLAVGNFLMCSAGFLLANVAVLTVPTIIHLITGNAAWNAGYFIWWVIPLMFYIFSSTEEGRFVLYSPTYFLYAVVQYLFLGVKNVDYESIKFKNLNRSIYERFSNKKKLEEEIKAKYNEELIELKTLKLEIERASRELEYQEIFDVRLMKDEV